MACDDDDDFIRGIFCPHVAVLCSDKAQEMCRKNNLSFCDLLNPFARLTDGKITQEIPIHCFTTIYT